jgi:uncharacterized surface anchored protein
MADSGDAMLILGLVLSALAAAPQSPLSDTSQIKGPDAHVAGRVLDAATHMPMSGARVVFAFRGRSRLQAVTDQDGRYEFAGLEPGPWRLSVQKVGYVPSDAALLPTFWLAAGQTFELPTVSLEKTGAIAGRIVDGAGMPVADVSVHAVKRGATADVGPLAVKPDDRGDFLISDLAPGDYVVAATAQVFDAVPTFYPGTRDEAAAATVSVGAGETRRDVIIVIRP